MDLTTPKNYPFKPFQLKFATPIYHPNISEEGVFCMDMLTEKSWKPAFTIKKVLEELLKTIVNPDVDNPANAAISEEYKTNKALFLKKATTHTRQNAMK